MWISVSDQAGILPCRRVTSDGLDTGFGENLVLEAHKAKDPSSAWWYGTVVKDKKSGWFPSSYVAEIQRRCTEPRELLLGRLEADYAVLTNAAAQATAKYAYTGNSDEELPFAEGDVLTIVDQSDADWYKAEKAGVVFIVPAAYVELSEWLPLLTFFFRPSGFCLPVAFACDTG
jgi:hypothetical protein